MFEFTLFTLAAILICSMFFILSFCIHHFLEKFIEKFPRLDDYDLGIFNTAVSMALAILGCSVLIDVFLIIFS